MEHEEARPHGGLHTVFDLLERAAMVVATAALGAIVLTVSWQVLARYVTTVSTAWAPELAQLLFVWLALLAVALGVRHNRHMLLDVWSGVDRPIVKVVISSVSMAAVVVVSAILVWYGIDSLPTSFRRNLPGLGISTGWITLAVPVGFGLSLLFALEAWWVALRGRSLVDTPATAPETV